jgi:hypothetical protein
VNRIGHVIIRLPGRLVAGGRVIGVLTKYINI